MDVSEFRKRGKEMVDYIADYYENLHERRVLPEVQPGYMRPMLPSRAPRKGEPWEDIMRDLDRAIVPGVRTHINPSGLILGLRPVNERRRYKVTPFLIS